MHEELFKKPSVAARYRTGPYAEARERYLRQAHSDGYSRSTLERMAWALLIIAEAVRDHGGHISLSQLERQVGQRIRLRNTHRPSEHTAGLLMRFGGAWLRSIGALAHASEPPVRFDRELHAFTEFMRVERGLSPVTIATRQERMRWLFASLPARLRSLGEITVQNIDAFLEAEARRGWSRGSLHALGSSVRSFFRYAAQQGWCRADLALGIDLPRLYVLEDVPRSPTTQEVDRLFEATAADSDDCGQQSD